MLVVGIAADCESVAEAADCQQVFRGGRIVLNFLTKPVDVYHDGVFVYYGFTPDDAVDHVFGEYVVYVVDEELDHRVFFGGERNLFVIFIKSQRGRVVFERTGGDDVARTLRRTAAASPDESLDLGN